MQLKGTYDVKLGKSFLNSVTSRGSTSNVNNTTNGNNSSSYMTMRCDFMPASVDRSQPGSVQVEDGREVTVSLPNTASAGAGSTVFRGSARPVQKECILIFNKRTGELTLEKIAHAVQLKKTREERKQSAPNVSNSEPKPVTTSPTSKKPTGKVKRGNNTGTGNQSTPTTKSRTLSASSSSSSCSDIESDGDHVINQTHRSPSAVKVDKPEQKQQPSGSDVDRKGKRQSRAASRSPSASSISSVSSTSSDASSTLSPEHNNDNGHGDSSSLSSLSDGEIAAENKSKVKNRPKGTSRRTSQQLSSAQPDTHRKLIEHDLRLSDSDIDSN